MSKLNLYWYGHNIYLKKIKWYLMAITHFKKKKKNHPMSSTPKSNVVHLCAYVFIYNFVILLDASLAATIVFVDTPKLLLLLNGIFCLNWIACVSSTWLQDWDGGARGATWLEDWDWGAGGGSWLKDATPLVGSIWLKDDTPIAVAFFCLTYKCFMIT